MVPSGKPGNKGSRQGGSWSPVESLGTRLVDKVVAGPQWKVWEQG